MISTGSFDQWSRSFNHASAPSRVMPCCDDRTMPAVPPQALGVAVTELPPASAPGGPTAVQDKTRDGESLGGSRDPLPRVLDVVRAQLESDVVPVQGETGQCGGVR